MADERTIQDEDFTAWLNSIEFIDKKGKVVTPKLGQDTSDDPEGDRVGT